MSWAVNLRMVQVAGGRRSGSALSVFLLGTVYGVAGVCAGPVLGSVLALAALGGAPLYGGIVLAVFAPGRVVPLFVLALVWPRLSWVRRPVRPREVRIGRWRNTWSQIVGGVLGIGPGVLLLAADGTASLRGLLGTSEQFTVEPRTLNGAFDIPDLVFVLVEVLAVASAWFIHRRRSQPRDQRSPVGRRTGERP